MALPLAPNPVYVQQGNAQAYVSWTLATGAASYSVQRSTDGVNFTVVASPATLSFLDTTVLVNVQYFYRVASVDSLSNIGTYSPAQSVVPTLPGKLSLGEIRLRSQQAADRVNSNFLTLPEWNFNINQSYYELYDLLITVYEDYYIAPRLIISTTGSQMYPLPNGQNNSAAPALYKLYGVDNGLGTDSNAWVTIKKFNFISRNRFVYPQLTSTFLGVFNLEYRMVGDNIMFIPTPSAGQFMGLWYFPRLTTMLADTDVMDGISGWTEYVIVDAAIKALRKEESDTSVLMQEKEALRMRIQSSAMNRDAGQPDTISDTRSWGERWGTMGGIGFDGSCGGY